MFKDLDLPNAGELFLKAKLGFEVFQIIEKRKLTQTETAKILGVKQPEISRLKQGKFNHYSVERLMTFLNRLNHDVEIRIIPQKIGRDNNGSLLFSSSISVYLRFPTEQSPSGAECI